MENVNQTPGALYVEALQARDAARKSIVPSEQIEHLQKCNESLLSLLEQITLFASPLAVILDGMVRKAVELQSTDRAAYDQLAKLFGDKLALAEGVLTCSMSDEFDFVRNYTKMVRDTVAREHGIDPSDEAAVAALLVKVGNEFALKAPNPQN